MSDTDIELMKLKLQGEMQQQLAQERREQANRDFWRWAIMYVFVALSPIVTLITNIGSHYVESKKLDKAVEVAVETKKDQGEKLTAIVGGVESSVKSWKAYQTK